MCASDGRETSHHSSALTRARSELSVFGTVVVPKVEVSQDLSSEKSHLLLSVHGELVNSKRHGVHGVHLYRVATTLSRSCVTCVAVVRLAVGRSDDKPRVLANRVLSTSGVQVGSVCCES